MADLIPAPRPVPTTEDRMRDTTNPTIEAAHVSGFNGLYPIGTPVRYWKGAREGNGKVSRTRTPAQLLSGHTAVVWLENVSGCIALTHVEPITEEEFTAAAAEQWPAAATGRSFRTYLDATERDRLDADNARLSAERDEALDDLQVERAKVEMLTANVDRYRRDRDDYREARDVLRAQLDQLRPKLAQLEEIRATYDTARDGLSRYRDAITAENAQWQAEIAHLRDLIRQYGDDGKIPVSAISKTLRDGPPPGLGSPSPRAQEPPAELPAWVLDLVRGLDRYELEHPKLYRLMGDDTYVQWACPAPLLALVPAEVRRQAEREG